MLARVQRENREGVTPHVTQMELFFDLVLVFAFIQISHLLLEHLTVRGALETLVLFAGVWWAWNYTAWATNWVDPDRPPVRAMIVVLMLLALLMAIAAPDAFGDRGLLFAVAYVLLQLVRGAFMMAAFGLRHRMGRNYLHLTVWSGVAGIGWIAGAFTEGDLRLALWAAAVVVDYAAPLHGFALPRRGRTPMRDWDLSGGHLAERFQLVVIIALGESVIEIGLTLTGTSLTGSVAVALVVGFVLTVSLWWMYFIRAADESTRALMASADPARAGRGGYAYGHAVMVGGIIVVAVAIADVLHHPGGETDWATAALALAGPALYIGGNAVFNYSLSCRIPRSRILGLLALAVIAPTALILSPAALLSLVTVITVVLALGASAPRRTAVSR